MIDYQEIFKDRLLIITGVGRSGTTILGKLIGSMTPVVYLFEPALFKIGLEMNADTFRGLLFEDYFLPILQGRAVNFAEDQSTWFGHYYSKKDLVYRYKALSRREEAIRYVKDTKPLFVVKANELHRIDIACLKSYFPSVSIMTIIRNGLDVVTSSVERGWYSDKYGLNALGKIWIGSGDWFGWNTETRCANIWTDIIESTLFDDHQFYENFLPYIIYEILGKDDEPAVIRLFESYFNLHRTKITESHIRDIKNHQPRKNRIDVSDIQEPVRTKFVDLMKRLSYL